MHIFRNAPVANIVLALAAGTFLLSYPFQDYAALALLAHMSGAAMIGGLADWYAVTALFTRPLGIAYKTALLPRSRERIIDTARTMVAEELLTVPHIYKVLKEEQMVVQIARYLLSDNGRRQVKQLICQVDEQLLAHLEVAPLLHAVLEEGVKGASRWQAAPWIASLLRRLTEKEEGQAIWGYVNRSLQQVMGSAAVRPYIRNVVEDMRIRYEGDHWGRTLVNSLAASEYFTSDKLVDTIQEKLVEYIRSQEQLNSPLGIQATDLARSLIDRIETDETIRQAVEAQKEELIRQAGAYGEYKLRTGGREWLQNFLLVSVDTQLQQYAQTLLEDESKRAPVERFCLRRIVPVLQKLRPMVDRSVVKALEGYSAEALTDMVRSRVGYDLQMIRINGSLVGALLGGLFYAVLLLIREVLS